MNNELMNDLIDWLLSIASKHDIRVKIEDNWQSNWPSQGSASFKLILYNPNWLPVYERPISLAHEIGHVLSKCEDPNPITAYSVDEKIEDIGNEIAVHLILDYCKQNDISFESKQQLIDAFDIPYYMTHNLDNELSHNKSNRCVFYPAANFSGLI